MLSRKEDKNKIAALRASDVLRVPLKIRAFSSVFSFVGLRFANMFVCLDAKIDITCDDGNSKCGFGKLYATFDLFSIGWMSNIARTR